MIETILVESDDDVGRVEPFGFHLPACRASSAAPPKHRSCKKPNCPVRVFVHTHADEHGGIWTPPIAQMASLRARLKECTARSPMPFPVGLHNMGATCYINSLLQMIYANVRFRNALLATTWASPIMRQMQRLFARMTLTTSPSITPSEFVDSLNINYEVQQDLHEFNKLLLQHIQSTAAPLRLVEDEYHGQLSFVTECCVCHTVSTRSESFSDLQLNLTESLERSFGELVSPELLQGDNAYSCGSCNRNQAARRRLRLDRLPPTINLHLLRFVFDKDTFRKAKSFVKTRIPKSMDLSEFVPGSATGPLIYDLIAVLRHQGASVDSGHFVVDVRSGDHQTWYRFNDHHVRFWRWVHDVVAGLATEDSINSSNAYMLVYTCRSAGVGTLSSSEAAISAELADEIAQENGAMEREFARLTSELDALDQRIEQRKHRVRAAFSSDRVAPPLTSNVGRDDSGVVVPIDWLREWTRHVPETPLDCSPIICCHGRLNPTQSTKMARVSNASWAIIEESLASPMRVSPTRDLCLDCVAYCHRLEHLSALLRRMQRDLDSEQKAVWISSQYLRALKAAVKSSSSLPSAQGIHDGVLCEHGGLSLSKPSRALISDDALTVLGDLMRSRDQIIPAPIGRDRAVCIICQEDRARNREERATDSSARKRERFLLKDSIRLGHTRPAPGTYYAIPSGWFDDWNEYTRAGVGKEALSYPGPVPVRSLLCKGHELLAHPLAWPESDALADDALSPLRLIAADEYPLLKRRYGVSGLDIQITIRPASDEKRDVSIESSHAVCYECIASSQQKALSYIQGTIRIIQEQDAEKTLRRKRKRHTRCSAIELCVNSSDAVGSLKLRIWEHLDVHPSRQSLIDCNSKPLPDSSTLQQCGITRNSTVILRVSEARGDDEDIAVDMDSAMDVVPAERRRHAWPW